MYENFLVCTTVFSDSGPHVDESRIAARRLTISRAERTDMLTELHCGGGAEEALAEPYSIASAA